LANDIGKNLEEKAAYFAQYWGQKVRQRKEWIKSDKDCVELISGFGMNNEEIIKKSYLLLTPLEDISDEDVSWIKKYGNFVGKNAATEVKAYLREEKLDDVQLYQYLQSKGYLLPFRGYSIEQLIEMGWVKKKSK
jgi:hypothetical protein